jgi:hypothetical protein
MQVEYNNILLELVHTREASRVAIMSDDSSELLYTRHTYDFEAIYNKEATAYNGGNQQYGTEPAVTDKSIRYALMQPRQQLLIEADAEPYHVGDHWWRDTPPDRFPVATITGGMMLVVARAIPDGMDEALRRRLLVQCTPRAVELARQHDARGNPPAAVFIADLGDPKGRQAAEATTGGDEIRRILANSQGASSVVSITVGVPNGSSYPSAWGGPIPTGKVAVQVVAHGGILNALVDAAA